MVTHEAVGRTQRPEQATLAGLGRGLLASVTSACGMAAGDQERALDWFEMLAEQWGEQRVGQGPTWPSDITDDKSPFEISLAIRGETVEARLLAEAGPGRNHRSRDWAIDSWRNARAVNARLERLGLELGRLRAIEDLFEPSGPDVRFAMWHGVCFGRGGLPQVKVYLNPCVAADPGRVAATALERLQQSWVLTRLSAADLRHCVYFSVDLSAAPEARTKVYVAHPGAAPDDVERAAALADHYQPGRAASLCRSLGGAGPYTKRPVLTCYAAVDQSRSITATVHFPIRCYTDDDAQALARIRDRLPSTAASAYERALSAFARRPLAADGGMQTYLSQTLSEGDRYTVYLAPQLYEAARRAREP